jgi:hypothetical protein
MKSVLLRTNFEGADLSDALMDRAVIVEANLRDAVLQVGWRHSFRCAASAEFASSALPAAHSALVRDGGAPVPSRTTTKGRTHWQSMAC